MTPSKIFQTTLLRSFKILKDCKRLVQDLKKILSKSYKACQSGGKFVSKWFASGCQSRSLFVLAPKYKPCQKVTSSRRARKENSFVTPAASSNRLAVCNFVLFVLLSVCYYTIFIPKQHFCV